MKEKNLKSIAAVVVGNTLEYFDMMLYVHFLVVLTPIFFPPSDPLVSQLLAITSFALGFLVRPIGSLIFGYIGDFFGRTIALSVSLLLMAVATFSISIIPSYEKIGISASVALITCRIVQSFSASGESVGASIYLVEMAPKNKECIVSSLVHVSTCLGGIFAAGLGYIFINLMGEKEGWRYPFIIGAGVATIGFYMRYKLKETRTYCKAQSKIDASMQISVKNLLKRHKKNIMAVAGLSFLDSAAFYIIYVQIPEMFKKDLGLSLSNILGHNTIVMFFDMLVCLGMAHLGDKYGTKKIIKPSCLLMLWVTLPLYLLIANYKSYAVLTLAQLVIILVGFGYTAPMRPYMASLFPTIGRYTGYAFGWYCGRSIVLGIGGFVCLYLKQRFGDIGPGFFLFFCAAVSYISLRFSTPYQHPSVNNNESCPHESSSQLKHKFVAN